MSLRQLTLLGPKGSGVGREPPGGDRQKLLEKVGWLGEYRKELGEWSQIMELVTTTEQFVREKGLYRGSHEGLEKELPVEVATKTTVRVKEELVRLLSTNRIVRFCNT
jgi:hypothetical protein